MACTSAGRGTEQAGGAHIAEHFQIVALLIPFGSGAQRTGQILRAPTDAIDAPVAGHLWQIENRLGSLRGNQHKLHRTRLQAMLGLQHIQYLLNGIHRSAGTHLGQYQTIWPGSNHRLKIIPPPGRILGIDAHQFLLTTEIRLQPFADCIPGCFLFVRGD